MLGKDNLVRCFFLVLTHKYLRQSRSKRLYSLPFPFPYSQSTPGLPFALAKDRNQFFACSWLYAGFKDKDKRLQ